MMTLLRLIYLSWYFLSMIIAYSIIIPILYFYFFSSFERESLFHEGFSFVVGVVGALGTAFIVWWITGFLPLDTSSIVLHALLVFLVESFIPFVGLPVLLMLALQAPMRTRAKSILSLEFGILTVFLPYIMLSGDYSLNLWSALMIPLNYVAFVFILDFSLRVIGERRADSLSDFFPELLLPLSALLLADLLKTFWYYSFPIWLHWTLAFALILSALFVRLYKYFR